MHLYADAEIYPDDDICIIVYAYFFMCENTLCFPESQNALAFCNPTLPICRRHIGLTLRRRSVRIPVIILAIFQFPE